MNSSPIAFSSVALVVALLTGATAVAGQAPTGNPAGANPATPRLETGRPERDTANAQDQLFLRVFSQGNGAEVALGNLAKTRGSAAGIKDFASRMTTDHGGAADRLKPLLQRTATPAPRDLDPEHRTVQMELEKLRGAEFDVAYIRWQIGGGQRTVQLLQWVIALGQSEAIKAFASESLPVVLEHLEIAKALHAQLTGAAP